MASPDSLPYCQVSCKASHNSYERDEAIGDQLTFRPDDPSRCGCRALELDIWRHSDEVEGFFTVSHTQYWWFKGPPLANYLGQLLSWHAQNPDHDVITITIDIKSSQGDWSTFPDEFDRYLRHFFNEAIIFKPFQLIHTNSYELCENVQVYGWPVLGDMKDKFIFCLSGNPQWKNYYASLDVRSRLCFADWEFNDGDSSLVPPSNGNVVFFNTNIYSDHHDAWKITIPRFKAKNMIVRAYDINGEELWDRSLAAGVSLLATDEVSGKSWAKVGDSPFVARRP